MSFFDTDAVLIKHRDNARPVSRGAPLGLLLNRVKRMHIRKGVRVEVVCGDTIYREREITLLLSSAGYREWLTTPSRAPPRRESRTKWRRGGVASG